MGLMIMGLFGGMVFPIAMGIAADAFGHDSSILIMASGVAFLFFYIFKFKASTL